jgi:hypothetical protein
MAVVKRFSLLDKLGRLPLNERMPILTQLTDEFSQALRAADRRTSNRPKKRLRKPTLTVISDVTHLRRPNLLFSFPRFYLPPPCASDGHP